MTRTARVAVPSREVMGCTAAVVMSWSHPRPGMGAVNSCGSEPSRCSMTVVVRFFQASRHDRTIAGCSSVGFIKLNDFGKPPLVSDTPTVPTSVAEEHLELGKPLESQRSQLICSVKQSKWAHRSPHGLKLARSRSITLGEYPRA